MTSSEKVNAPARSFCQNTANQALPLNGCHLEAYFMENYVMLNKRFHVHRAEHEAIVALRATPLGGVLPSPTKILTTVTSSRTRSLQKNHVIVTETFLT